MKTNLQAKKNTNISPPRRQPKNARVFAAKTRSPGDTAKQGRGSPKRQGSPQTLPLSAQIEDADGQVQREPQYWYDTVDLISAGETLLQILCGKPLEQQLHDLCRPLRLCPDEVLLIALRAKLLETGIAIQSNWVLPLARQIAEIAVDTRKDHGIS